MLVCQVQYFQRVVIPITLINCESLSYLGQGINEAVYVGSLSCLYYFISSNFARVVSVRDVVSDAATKQNRLL